jgi:hypothetical protein
MTSPRTNRLRLALALVVLVLVAVLVLRSSSPEKPSRSTHAEAPPTVVAPPTATATPRKRRGDRSKPPPRVHTTPGPDPEDSDPRVRARGRRELDRRPALQHMPFEADGVAVDFVDMARDGRVELLVTYTGRLAAARAAYRRFLAKWHDDGRGYRVAYRRMPLMPPSPNNEG